MARTRKRNAPPPAPPEDSPDAEVPADDDDDMPGLPEGPLFEDDLDALQRKSVKDEDTSSDDDAPLFVRTDWSKQKRHGATVVRGATKPQQNKYMGKEVATSWGGKLYSGKVTNVYNATADYNEGDYKRDLYTITWDDHVNLDDAQ